LILQFTLISDNLDLPLDESFILDLNFYLLTNKLRNRSSIECFYGISYDQIIKTFNGASVSQLVGEQVEIQIKYEGFIQRQIQVVANQSKLENQKIPVDFEYEGIPGLSCEVVQKLEKIRPSTLGQASRISGVTAAAVSIIMLMLKRPVRV
jgi:tRNA uridine 5-carboxymethylaminomethyl modification enzyme